MKVMIFAKEITESGLLRALLAFSYAYLSSQHSWTTAEPTVSCEWFRSILALPQFSSLKSSVTGCARSSQLFNSLRGASWRIFFLLCFAKYNADPLTDLTGMRKVRGINDAIVDFQSSMGQTREKSKNDSISRRVFFRGLPIISQ